MAPIRGYRAQVELANLDDLSPAQFVMRLPAYPQIAGALNPVHMAVLLTNAAINGGAQGIDQGWAHKAMTEHAFELIRLTTDLDLPSRLTSLFAFVDLEAAVNFATENGSAVVYEVEAPDAGHAATRDMALYPSPPARLNVDAAGFRQSWDNALDHARRYWSGDEVIEVGELLIDGGARIVGCPWRASEPGA